MQRFDLGHQSVNSDMRDLFQLLRSYWFGILLITLLCTLMAWGGSMLQPKQFVSTATGLVVTAGERDIASALAGDSLAQSRAMSYVGLASSRPVAEYVIESMSLSETPESLLGDITVKVPDETVTIQVTAQADSPQLAADLADAWVEALSRRVDEVETVGDSLGDAFGRVAIQPMGDASVPTRPSSPNMERNIALGLVAGLLAGLGYVFLRYRMDQRIHSAEEISSIFDLPVLGSIPREETLSDHGAIIETGFSRGREDERFSESLRQLRTNLSFVSIDRPPRAIVVTSPRPGEGKSLITANLAVAIASTGQSVVVVDGDLRRPAITKLFGMTSGRGVTDVLTGQTDVHAALQTYADLPKLRVLGAGQLAPNPTELLSSKTMRAMLDELSENAVVLIDAPPLLPYTDGALLTASADGAIVVATAQRTTREELSKALKHLEQVHGRVFGVVLNRVTVSRSDAANYGYSAKSQFARSGQRADIRKKGASGWS